MPEEFILTEENYYSDEANHYYLSAHTLMDFLENPTVCWLKHNGKLKKKHTSALVNGLLFHTFMEEESAFQDTLATYGEQDIFPKKKSAKKDWESLFNGESRPEEYEVLSPYYDVWDFIISHWDKREVIWQTRPNWTKEKTLTGVIGGVNYRGRLDALYVNKEKNEAIIFDHKTIAIKGEHQYGRYYDAEQECWQDKTFLEEYNYDLQLSVYQELVHQNYGIPLENIKFRFGLLVKSGSTQFVDYPSKYLLTEIFGIEEISHRRYSYVGIGNLTAKEYVEKASAEAHALINNPNPTELDDTLLVQLVQEKQTESIPIKNVHF